MREYKKKQNIFIKIGKAVLTVVMIGFVAITIWTSIDNGLYKNTWNNTFKKTDQIEQEEPEVKPGTEESKTVEVDTETNTVTVYKEV